MISLIKSLWFTGFCCFSLSYNNEWRGWRIADCQDGLSWRKVRVSISLHLYINQMGNHPGKFLRVAHLHQESKYQAQLLQLDWEDSDIHLRSMGLFLCQIQFLPELNQFAGIRGRFEKSRCELYEKIFRIQVACACPYLIIIRGITEIIRAVCWKINEQKYPLGYYAHIDNSLHLRSSFHQVITAIQQFTSIYYILHHQPYLIFKVSSSP